MRNFKEGSIRVSQPQQNCVCHKIPFSGSQLLCKASQTHSTFLFLSFPLLSSSSSFALPLQLSSFLPFNQRRKEKQKIAVEAQTAVLSTMQLFYSVFYETPVYSVYTATATIFVGFSLKNTFHGQICLKNDGVKRLNECF